jgi:hypothetical protein
VVWLEASSQKSHEPDYSNCRRFMRTVETPRAGSLAGMALKLCLPDRFDRLAMLLYLLLGWSGVMAYEAVLGALPGSTLTLLAAGGFLYTVGVIFHVWEGLASRTRSGTPSCLWPRPAITEWCWTAWCWRGRDRRSRGEPAGLSRWDPNGAFEGSLFEIRD